MSLPPVTKTRVALPDKRILILLIIGGVWVFLMVWRLDSRTLHVDEFITCYRATSDTPVTDYMHPRTYYLYMRLWARLFGSSDTALRLASLPPAALALFSVAVVAWFLLPWPGPVVALSLVALSSELLLYWRMARYFAPVAGAFGLAMLGAVSYLQTSHWAWLCLLTAGTVMCAYSDYLPTLSLLLPWAWVLASVLLRKRRREFGLVLAAAALGFLLTLPTITWALHGARHVTRPFHLDSLSTLALKGATAAWSLLASEVLPPWQTRASALAVLGSVALLYVGARSAWTAPTPWRLLLLAWPVALGIAWLALCFMPAEPPVRIASFSVHALPWAFLILALGWYRARARWWAHAALALVLLGNLVGLINYFTLRNHLNPQYALDWRQVARFMQAHAHPDDAVVTFYDAGFYRYYPHPGPREEAVSLRRGGRERLAQTLSAGHKVWMITRDRGSAEARRLAEDVASALISCGACRNEHHFLPYTAQEQVWRRAFFPTSTSYLTVFEFWLPQTKRKDHTKPSVSPGPENKSQPTNSGSAHRS